MTDAEVRKMGSRKVISMFREMSDEELRAKLVDLKNRLRQIRFDAVRKQTENPYEKREIRKNIARIYTILKEREKGIR